MREAEEKEAWPIVAGHSTLALMYLAMTIVLVSATGWKGLQQNLDITGEPFLLLFSLFVLNLLLALGSWRALRLSRLKQGFLLCIAIGVAVVSITNNALGWWDWYQSSRPADIGPAAVIGGALIALGYVILAYNLVRLISHQYSTRTSSSRSA